jgi:hypothetical protein
MDQIKMKFLIKIMRMFNKMTLFKEKINFFKISGHNNNKEIQKYQLLNKTNKHKSKISKK